MNVKIWFVEFERPKEFKARLAEKRWLNGAESFMKLHFELVEPKRLKFEAGQYLSLDVGGGRRRAYSIASQPEEEHKVELVAEIHSGGVASGKFVEMEPGDEVEFLAPLGRFVVKEDEKEERKFLFVGTGSGIVPLKTMIVDLLEKKGEKRPVRLHWGMRYEKDLFWLELFEELLFEYENFEFDLVLSRPPKGWELCEGHVQDCIGRDLGDLSEWEGYVCGNRGMVSELGEFLSEQGMREERIYFEKF